jgi:hypothetical protein
MPVFERNYGDIARRLLADAARAALDAADRELLLLTAGKA